MKYEVLWSSITPTHLISLFLVLYYPSLQLLVHLFYDNLCFSEIWSEFVPVKPLLQFMKFWRDHPQKQLQIVPRTSFCCQETKQILEYLKLYICHLCILYSADLLVTKVPVAFLCSLTSLTTLLCNQRAFFVHTPRYFLFMGPFSLNLSKVVH